MLQQAAEFVGVEVSPPLVNEELVKALGGIELKPAHYKRMRFIFEFGRPIHLHKLEGCDVALVAAGLAKESVSSDRWVAPVMLELTEAGREIVKARLIERRKAVAVHNTLASRLAAWLRSSRNCMTWEDATFSRPLGCESSHWTTVRIDVFACAYTSTARIAKTETFEVKRSLSDFRSELKKPEKSLAARELAEASWFVMPAGLVEVSAIPEGFGLLLETAHGEFEVVRRPKRKKGFMPAPETLMALVYRRATLPDSAFY